MIELIPRDWRNHLQDEIQKDYFKELDTFLEKEYREHEIYPPKEQIFEALRLTSFDNVKVVIIGQDPYHGPGQAHGLAFSVQKGVRIPPSLKNIYKELHSDIGMEIPTHGNLEAWAKQGVLMLNAVLTVRKSEAGSHRNKGWELFTDRIVEELNEKKENPVFILWGNYAKEKGAKIDRSKHLVLECAHPSPFSARLFFGNCHFSKVNEYLKQKKLKEIDWKLAPL